MTRGEAKALAAEQTAAGCECRIWAPAGSCCERAADGACCDEPLDTEAVRAHVMGCMVMCTTHLETYFARYGTTLAQEIVRARQPQPAHCRIGLCPACGDECTE